MFKGLAPVSRTEVVRACLAGVLFACIILGFLIFLVLTQGAVPGADPTFNSQPTEEKTDGKIIRTSVQ